jgi:hemoglobin-like flavoprotein
MMTPEQVELVQASFAKIAPRKDEVAGLVYERLFTLDPSLRSLFRGDMMRQRSRLALAIVMVVHGLKNQDAIVPVLEELGRRHVDYGVKPEHYATVGEAVLWALEQALGDDFSPEVREAWAEAYGLIARTMIDAAEGPATMVGRRAA